MLNKNITSTTNDQTMMATKYGSNRQQTADLTNINNQMGINAGGMNNPN